MSVALKAKVHIHTYERSATNKTIYRCTHPDCSHYHQKAYLLGKRARCYSCDRVFILSKSQLKNKRPVCEYCSKSPKAQKFVEAERIALELIEKELELDPFVGLPDEFKLDEEHNS